MLSAGDTGILEAPLPDETTVRRPPPRCPVRPPDCPCRPAAGGDTPAVQQADPAYRIRFPEDEGSHPAFGEEWWYISGWLDVPDGDALGFQITFFRLRQDHGEDGRSLSEPRQIFVGHAALSDPVQGAALHDQRVAPANLGQAEAREGAMDVRMGDWSVLPVTGTAWLDREWFTAPEWIAQPRWDWIGINLADGGALMASRVRDDAGDPLWAFGSIRDASGALTVLGPTEVTFTPLRQWRSPSTGIVFPVAWRVRAGEREVTIEPMMDDQEYDARETSRLVYWEGAARALEDGKPVGRGYLELTGYGHCREGISSAGRMLLESSFLSAAEHQATAAALRSLAAGR